MTLPPAMPAENCPGRADGQARLAAGGTAMRYVTENRAMPRGRKPDGEHAMSNAERQARHRARHLTQPSPIGTRARRPTDRHSCPQRWRDAVIELLTLQGEYANWLTALPDSLRNSPAAEVLETIVELDLVPLAEIVPP